MYLRIPKFFVCWLTLAFYWCYTCLSYVSYQNKQRHNISTRITLNSSQLIDRSITNGAKLINLPPETPLSVRLISWLETRSKQRSQYITARKDFQGEKYVLLQNIQDKTFKIRMNLAHDMIHVSKMISSLEYTT